jgi:arylsulfatase A-like enzyme
LIRLLATEVPCGALLGLLSGALWGVANPESEAVGSAPNKADATGLRRWRTAIGASLFTLMISPAVGRIAWLLFTGGKMSRLGVHTSLKTAVAAALICATWVAFYFTHRLLADGLRAPIRNASYLVIGLLGTAFLIGKIDQRVLPNQYAYLHGAATYVCWVASAVAFTVAAGHVSSLRTFDRRLPYAGLALALLLAITGRLNLATLDADQNVLVALIDPRASHCRSLMRGIEPLMKTHGAEKDALQAYQAARKARLYRSRRSTESDGLLALPDANVLIITVDALRADRMSVYGYHRPTTPNLKSFAAHSVVFEHAYTQVPHSSFSIASLMTSEYLHETVEIGLALPRQTLATVLAEAGYFTAGFFTGGIFYTEGVRLKEYESNAFGFALNDQAARDAEATTDRVLAEIDRTVSRGEPKSFYWVHYFDVHEPYRATTFGKTDSDRYDSEIQKVDRAVVRLIDEAKRRFKRDLIVVVSADHGEEFYEHGGVYHGSTLYEEQVHVPLIIQAPGLEHKRIKNPVELVDVAPTLLALLGIRPPSGMRGDDLRSLASGQPRDLGPVFSAVIHKRMVVSWPYKLIADLRFGLYELYNLEADPRERQNLADQQPALVRKLRGEVYAWLDSLQNRAPEKDSSALAAVNLGRLGDRRAVKPLCSVVLDPSVPTHVRVESARILGKLADETASNSLLLASESAEATVAAEASIALGRMFDQRARSSLRRLVLSEDPELRARAGVSLGRLRDVNAVPALIDALWIAPSQYDREEAIRWLGRLHDNRGLEPLLDLLPDLRTRYLVVIAMGQLGDRRAFDPLADLLKWDNHSNVRDNAIQGLGLLRDPRAIDLIVPLAVADPSLKTAGESLVRLHAIDCQAVGGTDGVQGKGALSGFGYCYQGPEVHDWDYLHRTWCETTDKAASLNLSIPETVSTSDGGSVALLMIKRTDAPKPAELVLSVGDIMLEPVQVDGKWSEFRWPLKPGTLSRGHIKASIYSPNDKARFAIDHLLLLPKSAEEPPRLGG